MALRPITFDPGPVSPIESAFATVLGTVLGRLALTPLEKAAERRAEERDIRAEQRRRETSELLARLQQQLNVETMKVGQQLEEEAALRSGRLRPVFEPVPSGTAIGPAVLPQYSPAVKRLFEEAKLPSPVGPYVASSELLAAKEEARRAKEFEPSPAAPLLERLYKKVAPQTPAPQEIARADVPAVATAIGLALQAQQEAREGGREASESLTGALRLLQDFSRQSIENYRLQGFFPAVPFQTLQVAGFPLDVIDVLISKGLPLEELKQKVVEATEAIKTAATIPALTSDVVDRYVGLFDKSIGSEEYETIKLYLADPITRGFIVDPTTGKVVTSLDKAIEVLKRSPIQREASIYYHYFKNDPQALDKAISLGYLRPPSPAAKALLDSWMEGSEKKASGSGKKTSSAEELPSVLGSVVKKPSNPYSRIEVPPSIAGGIGFTTETSKAPAAYTVSIPAARAIVGTLHKHFNTQTVTALKDAVIDSGTERLDSLLTKVIESEENPEFKAAVASVKNDPARIKGLLLYLIEVTEQAKKDLGKEEDELDLE